MKVLGMVYGEGWIRRWKGRPAAWLCKLPRFGQGKLGYQHFNFFNFFSRVFPAANAKAFEMR